MTHTFSSRDPLQYLGDRAIKPPNVFREERAPTSADNSKRYVVGDLWIDIAANGVHILTDRASDTAVWTVAGTASGSLLSLTGDSGGAITPDGAGNIDVTGGNGVVSAGSGNAVDFAMQSPFTGDFTFIDNVNGRQELIVENQSSASPAANAAIRIFTDPGGGDGYFGVDNGSNRYAWGIRAGEANEPFVFTDASEVAPPIIGDDNERLKFTPGGSFGFWKLTSDQVQFDGLLGSFAGGDFYKKQAGVQIGATTTETVDTITLDDPNTVTVVWEFSASLNPATEAGGGTVTATARRSGGGAVLLGSPVVSFNDDFAGAAAVTADVNGNDLRLRFTTGTNGPVNVIATAKVQPLVNNT